ncbi:hypothetical protein AC578_10453 [Pseudocercospora eumusae]|uniref:Uncharacterized protein n=1 Tax=Pseudocercospora eumusae TaxID=321146 RepID=A0A139H2D0_9PEZI|nr:hypothetical protein AC578_10453 [Pseudocercospora eumusae]
MPGGEKVSNRGRTAQSFNHYSLSHAGTNQFTHWLQGELQKILASDIGPEHRQAIEIEQEYVGGLEADAVEDMVERARVLLLEFSAILPEGSK